MGRGPVNVAVIGAGKMGLPLACVFASRGARVVACDVNPETVRLINQGQAPFEEPGISDLLLDVVTKGRLRATTDNRAAIAESQVVIVIVPVMLTPERDPDLSIIEAISDDLAHALNPGSLVCYETTLPVGETRRLGQRIARGGLVPGASFDLAFSPERVKSRFVLRHLFANPKVVGGITPAAAERAARFYSDYLGAPVTNVGTLEAAELVKLAGMAYRDVNIALANELAAFAERAGIDFEPVRAAANTDGEAALLLPGIGVGGHCTPVYPHFLLGGARHLGVALDLTAAGRAINDDQPRRALDRIGPLTGRKVLILGVSFRPEVKEVAYSPAFSLQQEVTRRGGIPLAHDPLYTAAELRDLGFTPSGLEGSQVVVLNTGHEAYRILDFAALAQSGTEVVLDGRNLWEPDVVRAAGLRYVGIGRPAV